MLYVHMITLLVLLNVFGKRTVLILVNFKYFFNSEFRLLLLLWLLLLLLGIVILAKILVQVELVIFMLSCLVLNV